MSRKIAAVLIDLSGTIHIDDYVIPGAVEALKRLRSTNLKIKFVTNTTKESKRILHERLTKIGFEIDKQEIFTSLTAAHQLLSSRNLRPLMLVANAAHEEFNDINKENPNAVLVGLAPDEFHYEKLTEAFRLIMEGATLVAIHKARYYMRKDGLALGPGAFVTGLEYSTGCKSEVVGKPEANFFHTALEDLECKPEEAIMIGDDARDDVAGAQAAGLLGILVKTGKYRSEDETKINPSPEYVADSFTQAVDYIIEKYI